MHWYLEVLKKYAVFTGRARRREYWMFFLVNFIVGLVLAVIGQVLDLEILQYLYSLAVLLPGLGVSVRRLHDTGRSGWWLLISLVPLIGAIVLLVFLVSDSQPDTNQYGPNPKTAVA
ncbi:DUF805 domain-containing protein [Streptomyces thermovulgaris]|uniref:DUF805 domain-containing protein n=1 Tax=Streptomyces thermovulgaris TaxID=1934 RepID=UPI000A3C9B8D|nr:DUF805 domain-containing protein [Streptomyces thermovulgaris]